jgi:uncharacterized membrane protein (GlpM family)
VTFAGAAAVGSLAGALAEAAFCLAYGRLAARGPWPLALASSGLTFVVVGLALQHRALTLAWLLPAVVVTLVLAFHLMPVGAQRGVAPPPPRWDIPARMAVTTGLVLLLTGAAPALGPRLAGLLATFPLYAAILAVFAHRQEGPGPAVQVLRGLLLGLFSFAAFFAVLAALLERAGMALAFTAAVAAALVLQLCSLVLVPGRK